MEIFSYTSTKIIEPPAKDEVSAVFVFALNNQKQLLATKNERGWDIPGGHTETNEELEDALIREVLEETSTTIKNIHLRYSVSYPERGDKKMLFYTADIDEVLSFQKRDDVFERAFLTPKELLEIYNGGEPELFRDLLTKLNLR